MRKPRFIGTGIHIHQQKFDNVIPGDTFWDADFGMMIYTGVEWVEHTLSVGDKVHYIPHPDADPVLYQNGIIKSVIDANKVSVRFQNGRVYTVKTNELCRGWRKVNRVLQNEVYFKE